jgi:hypothetical protein
MSEMGVDTTEDGVTRYPGVGLHAAYAAVGDDVTGDRPYLLEFRWR